MSGVTSSGCSSAAAAALLRICCGAVGVEVSPPERSHQLLAGWSLHLLQLSPNCSPHKIGLAIFSPLLLDLPGYTELVTASPGFL